MKLQLKQIEWKKELTKHVGYNIAMLLCAVLSIFFLVLTIIALFSFQKNEGIAVKEVFDVSSSPLDSTNQNFVIQLSGYLINYEDRAQKVEKILVVVGDGRERKEMELEGLTLYPRLAQEIRHEWKADFAFNRVHSVSVVQNGQQSMLANHTAEWEFNPNGILYAVLCAISCFGTVFVSKKRYYRYQEDQMALHSAGTEE